MKKFNFLKTIVLALILFAGTGNAWGQKTYNLVTSEAELVAGGKYLIVGLKGSDGYALSTQNTNNRASASVTISSGSISTTPATAAADTKPFEITLGGTSGTWTLYDAVNSAYLRPRTGSSNGLQGNSTSQNWTISVAESGVATMVCENTTAYPRNILRFNSTNTPPLFACYASGQTDVYLYKEATASSCTAPNLAFAAPTITKSVTDAPFAITATSDNGTTAITYSSLDTDVATVNAATGEVTIVGAGNTTITASQEAGAHSSVDYCAETATYVLTVTAPTITVLPTSLNFSKTLGALTPAEDLIEVTGANLTADIIVGITGTDAALFDVDVSTISMSGGSASDVLVVTYTPTALGSHTATLTLSSAGAADKTVALSGTAALVTPVATAASSIGNFGFTANWEAATGAESYVLDVYTKEGGGTTTETEGFDGVIPDGNLISSATYLAGWSASSQGSNRQIYTSAGNYGVSSPSFAFTTTGDYVETATYLFPVTEFKFWAKQQSGATSSTLIEGYNGTAWTTIATLSNADVATTAEGTNAVYDLTALGHTDIVKIKMTFTKALGNLSIDDISVTYGGVTITPVSGSPFTVVAPSVSRAITGLTNDKMYFYTVKAVDGSFESALSNEVGPIELTSTGVNNATALSGIAIHNGNLMVPATAGTLIEVYNIAGQKIVSQIAKEGVNTIAIAQRGAMIVKIGTETVKVVF